VFEVQRPACGSDADSVRRGTSEELSMAPEDEEMAAQST